MRPLGLIAYKRMLFLKRCLRITKNFEYIKVYRAGRRWSCPFFNMYIKKNELGFSRLGVSVSKKVGKSVVRNKIKRRVKEVFRINIDFIKKGYDVVLSAKPPAADIAYDKVENEMKSLFKRGHIWHV